MKIGFMGLGIMGSRMAMNLLKNNYELIVYNRTREKALELIEKGAEYTNKPDLVGKNCSIIFTMLSDPDSVKAIAFGNSGFLKAMKENSLWIDCTTVDPEFTKTEHKEAAKRNIRFIDAPVAGSMIPAEKGELVFLAGGDALDIEEAEQYFNIMGKKTIKAGGVSKGTSLKMIINVMLSASMAVYAESISLGLKMGFDKSFLMEILNNLPVTAPFLALKKDKVLHDNYEAEFKLKLMHKDIKLANEMAEKYHSENSIIKKIEEIYKLNLNKGCDDMDFSVLIKLLS